MKKNLKKAILVLATMAMPGVVALTSVACATPKPKSIIALDGEIKYLAFGDSVSAGYNAQMGFDAPGKMENGVIEGLSYPAFIAKYIQEMDSKRLTSFDNYGLSGSTVKDWLYILGDQQFKDESKKNLDRFLKQDTAEHNPANIYAGRIAKQFGKMGDNPTDFDGFKAKIKQANLMTVSLGANDFLKVLYAADLGAITKAKNEQEKKAALDLFSKTLSDAGKSIVSDMIKLNNLIRRINPDVKIAYVGYAMPLLRVVPVLDGFLGEVNGKKVSTMLLDALNKIVRNGAKLSGHSYVATYNESEWNERPELLSTIFYDIHPTGKGYKKMAQEVLLKLAIYGRSSKQDYNHYYDRTFADTQQWNSKVNFEYWSQDRSSYNRFLNLGTNTELISRILGSSNNEKLWENSSLEQTPSYVEAIVKNKPNVGIALREFLLRNTGITKILGNVVLGFITQYDKDGSLATMLTGKDQVGDKTRISKLLEAIINGKFFVKAVAGIQQEIDTSDLDNNKLAGVQTLSKDILFSALIKQLMNKENIKLLIKDLLTTKIEGTNQSILNYASPIFVKLLASTGFGDASTGEFFLTKDTSGINNLEKLVQTLTTLPAFDTILDKMEAASNSIPSNRLLSFSDLTGALFAGIKSDLNLLHQLITQFITSDFVKTQNEVVKVQLSKLLRGTLGTILGSMLVGEPSTEETDSSKSEVITTSSSIRTVSDGISYKPVASPFDDPKKIGEFLIKPKATQIFLGKLLESLLENKDNFYSETKTLGEMFEKLFANHKKDTENWVVQLLETLVKQPWFRDYYFYEATMGIAGYLEIETTESKQEHDSLKITNFKKWNNQGFSRFSLATQKELDEIRGLIAFAIDYALPYTVLIHSEDKRDPGLKIKIYNILKENIGSIIDGTGTSSKLVLELKKMIKDFFKFLLIYVPGDLSIIEKQLGAKEFQQWMEQYKKIKKINERFGNAVFSSFWG